MTGRCKGCLELGEVRRRLTEAQVGRDLAERNRDEMRGFYVEASAKRISAERRLWEADGLLLRIEKYCREDGARTPGFTRLERCLDEVRAYLAAMPKEGG